MLDKKPDLFDALVAEWIGEVGQLHHKIQQLPAAMHSALSPTETLIKSACAGLAKQLDSLPNAADKEMNRASNAAITRLSIEVGQIAQKIAGDTALAARYKSISNAIIIVSSSAVTLILFSGYAGFKLGENSEFSGSILLTLTSWAFIASVGYVAGHTISSMQHSKYKNLSKIWTEEEFHLAVAAAQTTSSHLKQGILEACWSILIHGEGIKIAAFKNMTSLRKVEAALKLLKSKNKDNKQ